MHSDYLNFKQKMTVDSILDPPIESSRAYIPCWIFWNSNFWFESADSRLLCKTTFLNVSLDLNSVFNQSPAHGTSKLSTNKVISFPMELFILIWDDLGGLEMVIYDDSILFLIKNILREIYGPSYAIRSVNSNHKIWVWSAKKTAVRL